MRHSAGEKMGQRQENACGDAAFKDILETAETWLSKGRTCALATVIQTWGSAPRPVGSHLLIDNTGHFEGSVSGGCVEGEVVTEALDALEDGRARMLEFGVADETAWRVGLSCGGRIIVRVEPLQDENWLSKLNKLRRSRKPACRIIDLATGADQIIEPGGSAGLPSHRDTLNTGFRTGRSVRVHSDNSLDTFFNFFTPAVRIVAIGAVHISQALAPIARTAGFDLSIIDPRTAFASPERFQYVSLIPEWPEEAFTKAPLDPHTALIAVTHDPKIDDPALLAALTTDCFYVGALGSRKTHAKRLDRLAKAGASPAALDRIKAPIGLNIGATTPAEIAVAIMAEIIQELRGPKPRKEAG